MERSAAKQADSGRGAEGESARKYRVALAGVLIVAGAFRLVGLDRFPPAINQDEAVHAYDTYCVRTVGMDHWGQRWPIFFRSFGAADYHAGVYHYVLLPIQALLGMNVLSTRLPAALLGTLHVAFVYLLLRRLYDRRIALLAAMLLAVCPWAVLLSRIAFEVALCPGLTMLGLWLLARSGVNRPESERVRPAEALALGLAGLALGLAMWTYNAYRIIVPLLLVGGGVLFAPWVRGFLRRPNGWRGAGVAVAGFVLALSPFLWATVRTPEQAWGRALHISILGSGSDFFAALPKIARAYLIHFHPDFLFFRGDRIQQDPGWGQLHHLHMLLLPLGLWRVVRRARTERFGWFVVYWILVSPLPAALTLPESPNWTRASGVLPAYDLLAAFGLSLVLEAARRRSPRTYRTAATACGAAIAANVAAYVGLFVLRYPVASYRKFQAEWAEVMPEVRRRESEYDAVLLTTRGANQLYMLYLFWGRVDPRECLDMARQVRVGEQWDYTAQLGKVLFWGSEVLPELAKELSPGARVLVAERPGVPVPGRELKRYVYPTGQPALVLYHVELPSRRAPGPGEPEPPRQ